MPLASPATASKKSPCANCVPAASGLGFRSPGCEPNPALLFYRPSECHSHPPRLPARNRRARTASPPHLAWVFALQGADQNLSAFSIARLNAPRIPGDCQQEIAVRELRPRRIWLGFSLSRVRTKPCPPFLSPV